MISSAKQRLFLHSNQLLNVSSIQFRRQPTKQMVDFGQNQDKTTQTKTLDPMPSQEGQVMFEIEKDKYMFHFPPSTLFNQNALKIPESVGFLPENLKDMYKQMVTIRRFEMASDAEYKKKKIRGFCHLYDGQEAVAVGISAATTFNDQIITAYRCHAYALARGDPCKKVMAEEFGRYCGSSKGKGGSMHLYNVKNNFYGGNGIVGAQVPVGVGLNFGNVYNARLKGEKLDRICFALMGDGAAQQGQVYEAMNLAALFRLPVVFVVEDNRYSMGTSTNRSAFDTGFYRRGNFIPGIQVDGQNVFQVYAAAKAAKEYALKESLPILLHMQTYRYHGHSMSDAGLYRSGEEVSLIRAKNDPIKVFKDKLDAKKLFPQEFFDKVDEDVKKEVKESVKFAEKCDLPPEAEIARDIYQDKEYTVRGRSIHEVYHVK